MHDPFPIPPVPFLSKAVQPFSDYFGLTTLPLHIHEVLIAFLGYTFINIYVAPWISTWLFPVRYPKLNAEKKMNWDVHVVSLCQSSLINILALWVMFKDEERWNMDWQQRVWGYTGGAGMIQGLAAGYFLWDLMITIRYLKSFGPGMLAHAASALTVFSFGFVCRPTPIYQFDGYTDISFLQRPFLNFYGCTFILYELSSPFLNFHWFFDKLEMTGSLPQFINGIFLISTFFGCRLVWGTYQSVRVYQDVWNSLHHTPAAAGIDYGVINSTSSAALDAAVGRSAVPIHDGIMRFAGEEDVPFWLAFTYLGSNIILNTLNFYWFGKMIEALRKRFTPQKDKKKEKAIATKSIQSNGAVRIDVDQTEIRRRRVVEVDAEEEDESATLS
jgi:hypothetical protein